MFILFTWKWNLLEQYLLEIKMPLSKLACVCFYSPYSGSFIFLDCFSDVYLYLYWFLYWLFYLFHSVSSFELGHGPMEKQEIISINKQIHFKSWLGLKQITALSACCQMISPRCCFAMSRKQDRAAIGKLRLPAWWRNSWCRRPWTDTSLLTSLLPKQ